MVAEQRVSVDEVQLALRGVRETPFQSVRLGCGIEAKQVVQPPLDWVPVSVPDWLVQTDFVESAAAAYCRSSFLVSYSNLVLFPQALQKF